MRAKFQYPLDATHVRVPATPGPQLIWFDRSPDGRGEGIYAVSGEALEYGIYFFNFTDPQRAFHGTPAANDHGRPRAFSLSLVVPKATAPVSLVWSDLRLAVPGSVDANGKYLVVANSNFPQEVGIFQASPDGLMKREFFAWANGLYESSKAAGYEFKAVSMTNVESDPEVQHRLRNWVEASISCLPQAHAVHADFLEVDINSLSFCGKIDAGLDHLIEDTTAELKRKLAEARAKK
jgi:hypothetical protein